MVSHCLVPCSCLFFWTWTGLINLDYFAVVFEWRHHSWFFHCSIGKVAWSDVDLWSCPCVCGLTLCGAGGTCLQFNQPLHPCKPAQVPHVHHSLGTSTSARWVQFLQHLIHHDSHSSHSWTFSKYTMNHFNSNEKPNHVVVISSLEGWLRSELLDKSYLLVISVLHPFRLLQFCTVLYTVKVRLWINFVIIWLQLWPSLLYA